MTDATNPHDEIREVVARAIDPYAQWGSQDTVPPHLRRSYANQRGEALDKANAAIAAHKQALYKAGLVIVPGEPSGELLGLLYGPFLSFETTRARRRAYKAMIAKAEEETDEKHR
ncbi:MAG: hypothetical protein ACE5HV_00030 [Acidobacteriota bacterium]